jgi:translation initiation factor 1
MFMNKRKTSSSSSFVYSTDPTFISQQNLRAGLATQPPEYQKLKVSIDKKQRAGKVVTLVTGFEGREEDILTLSKQLKSVCGTGGSVKDNTIIVQGDNRQKIFQWLQKSGYKLVKQV